MLWGVDRHNSQGALSYHESDSHDPAAHSADCKDIFDPFFLDHDANCTSARLITNVVQSVSGSVSNDLSDSFSLGL